jgi:hypothetical protein
LGLGPLGRGPMGAQSARCRPRDDRGARPERRSKRDRAGPDTASWLLSRHPRSSRARHTARCLVHSHRRWCRSRPSGGSGRGPTCLRTPPNWMTTAAEARGSGSTTSQDRWRRSQAAIALLRWAGSPHSRVAFCPPRKRRSSPRALAPVGQPRTACDEGGVDEQVGDQAKRLNRHRRFEQVSTNVRGQANHQASPATSAARSWALTAPAPVRRVPTASHRPQGSMR